MVAIQQQKGQKQVINKIKSKKKKKKSGPVVSANLKVALSQKVAPKK